jgi:hypothetical protein
MVKRRHHYLPQFYLKGFIDPDNSPHIWVYDKEGEDIIKSTARDIAVEKHYFSFIDVQGKRDSETLENMIAKIEKDTADVVKKILSYKPITTDEKALFAIFISYMMIRPPNYRKNIENAFAESTKIMMQFMASNKKVFKASIKRFEKNTNTKIGMPIRKLRNSILDDSQYEIKTNPEVSLEMSFSHLDKLAEIFFNMKWAFLTADEKIKFLTGDNPLHYFDPTYRKSLLGVGLINENIIVTLPISQNLAAIGTWKGKDGYFQANTQMIKNINRSTVVAALRFVFASKKSEILKKFVKKYKDSSPKIKVSHL